MKATWHDGYTDEGVSDCKVKITIPRIPVLWILNLSGWTLF